MRSKILVSLAVALVALAGATVAATQIPDAKGVIHACRKVDGGALRVVARSGWCRASERPLSWNQRGVQGETGPAGPKGEKGETGAQGPAGPALVSFDALVGLGCTAGAKSGTIAIAYDSASGNAQIRCVTDSGPPEEAVVRINEFSTGTEGALANEFVELVNAGTAVADLSGYKLVYRSAAGTSDVSLGTLPEGTMLAAGAFFLFGGSGYAGAHAADKTFATGLASAGGGLALRTAEGAIVDSVAWGEATNAFVEGVAAAAPPIAAAPGKSGARHPDGHDTDNNGADFTIAEVSSPGGGN
jgi:Lamin Tail Domain